MSEVDEEKIEDIKKNIFRHPNAENLPIKRIPKDTVKIFKKFSNDEFVGDYGMALKWLVDNLLVEDVRISHLTAVLQNHEGRLAEIENKKPERIKTLMGGRKIKLPSEE